MMNYLKDYNISDDQIKNIEQAIKNQNLNIDIFKYDPEEITSIIDLFVNIGVTNIYGIIITNPSIFRDTVSSIKKRIDECVDKNELARLLNEDPNNLSLIGLL